MAPRRPGSFPPDPEPKSFSSLREIEIACTKLQRRLDEVVALDSQRVRFDAADRDVAESNIASTILEVFGPKSSEYQDLRYHKIWKGTQYIEMDDGYSQKCFVEGIQQTKAVLSGLLSYEA